MPAITATATPAPSPTPGLLQPFAGKPEQRPYVTISGEISGNLALLNALGSSPQNLDLTYTWWQDAADPARLEITPTTGPNVQVSIPNTPGEYYVNVTAADTQGNRFTARRIITVNEQGAYLNTIEQPAQWINHITLYEIEAFDWGAPNLDHFVFAQQYLDKLVQLGVNTIMFTPIFQGDSLGYGTTDYYRIDPALGLEQNFRAFVKTAHQKNIKIVLDLVFNHTSIAHPFFKDVLENKDQSAYADFYLWKGKPGASDYDYYYKWKNLPNLNVTNPQVQDYLFKVAEYWLINYDIDGYRADVAWGVEKRSNTFWKDLAVRLKNIKPEIFLLGEGPAFPEGGDITSNFSSQHDKSILFDERFTAAYDWRLRGWKKDGGLQGALGGLLSLNQLNKILNYEYPAYGLPLRFIENHDVLRVTSLYDNERSKLAHALVFTVPGIPLIYGGAEVGQKEEYAGLAPDTAGLLPYFSTLINARKNYIDNYSTLKRLRNNQDSQVYSYATLSKASLAIAVLNFGKSPAAVRVDLSPIADILPQNAQMLDIFANQSIQLGEDLTAFQLSINPYGAKVYLMPLNNK